MSFINLNSQAGHTFLIIRGNSFSIQRAVGATFLESDTWKIMKVPRIQSDSSTNPTGYFYKPCKTVPQIQRDTFTNPV
jgi:hypothetical protein